jgi:glutamine synthetase
MHTHLSISKGEKNLFYDENDKYKLSEIAKKFLAGILKHCREICLTTNPTVNSFKRIVPGYEAPVYITWATINRSDMIRVPTFRREKSARIEYRVPDPACNPYLAFASILAAGLEGIEKDYPLPPPTEENVYHMPPKKRIELGIDELPGSLIEAIRFAENSKLLKEALGPHVFYNLIESKKIEWDKFRCHVTEYEINTFLPIL